MTGAVDGPVGWVGAGRMGHAMVERLLAAGVPVLVWNRTRAAAVDLADRGARLAGGLADLAGCATVCTTLTGDDALREVTVGDGGLLRQPAVPRHLIDLSTVSARTSAEIRAAAAGRGTALLAAPVSGNPGVVRSGGLSVAVSGPLEAYQAVEPVLRLIGPSVVYVGDGEQARLVKLAHNMLLGVLAQALAEVVVLAERCGVPRGAFLEFLNGSVLGSPFTRYKTPAYAGLDLTPTFTTDLLRKDLDLGLAAAGEARVPVPVVALTAQLVRAAATGHGAEDFAALLLEVARGAGLSLEAG